MKTASLHALSVRLHQSGWSLALCLLSALLVGCTFAKVKPEVAPAALTDKPTTLLVGDVQVTEARLSPSEKDIFSHAILYGISGWIEKHGAVLTVQPATTNAVADTKAITVTGTVYKVEKGSQAMRFLVGMGAGQAKMEGEFEVRDAAGTVIEKFTARRSYLGGSGMGGIDMVSTEDLARQLGQSVGETIAEWVAGKNLERTKD